MTDAWKQWEGEVVDNRYRLRQFLGGSDHSAVFLAEFDQPPRKAALKFVEANSATAQLQLSRWERAAKLSHQHLIRLIQGGRCQLGRVSMLYVATEFAEDNLGQILPNRPLTQAETEYMLRSVLEVLAYLHAQGLVHSRLKPGNIMAVGDTMKVSSDGICAVGDKRLGHVPPTVYDPPEAATAGFSPAGDVWSLGVALVEAVTQRPSAGESIRQADPTLPDTVPAAFLEIARQCLRLDPQRRWTVSDIAARLLPTASAAGKKHVLSRSAVWVGAGTVLLFVLFAGSRWMNRRTPEPSRAPQSVVKQPDLPPAGPTVVPKPVSTPPVASEQIAAEKTSDQTLRKPNDPSTTIPAPQDPAPPAAKPTGDSAPGTVAEQMVPPVSQRSRDTITGKVRVTVRVSVDVDGRVTDATLAAPGPSQYFANLALGASKRWKFSPPRVRGESVPSEWYLRYAFGREKTDVQPVQLSPAP
jgi:TonB family protein